MILQKKATLEVTYPQSLVMIDSTDETIARCRWKDNMDLVVVHIHPSLMLNLYTKELWKKQKVVIFKVSLVCFTYIFSSE